MYLFGPGKTVQSVFFKLSSAQINSATTAASAVRLGITNKISKMLWLDNTTNVDLSIFVQKYGTSDTDSTERILLIELPANRPINFNRETFCEIPAQTLFWVAKVDATAATSGYIRLFAWGI